MDSKYIAVVYYFNAYNDLLYLFNPFIEIKYLNINCII